MPAPVVTPLRTPGRAPRVLTIDAEDWFHVCGDDYYSDPRRWEGFPSRFERTFAWLLERLGRGGHRATVFVLGWIAERHPDLVKEAARQGHEIALHGDLHRRADELSPAEFLADLDRGRDRLEKACGIRAELFRAAEWSIRSPQDAALRVLAAQGFVADASMTAMPPLGLAANLLGPHRIALADASLIEVPPLTGRGFGRRIPAGGSWGFRLLRTSRLAAFEEAYRQRGHPAVFTFHPWEFDAEHPPMDGLSPIAKLVHFAGRAGLAERFETWLAQERCVALGDALPELRAA